MSIGMIPKNISGEKKITSINNELLKGRHDTQDTRNAKIITLYKNKGYRSDCSNYKGIHLFPIAGKAFAKVVLPRFQKLAKKVHSKS